MPVISCINMTCLTIKLFTKRGYLGILKNYKNNILINLTARLHSKVIFCLLLIIKECLETLKSTNSNNIFHC